MTYSEFQNSLKFETLTTLKSFLIVWSAAHISTVQSFMILKHTMRRNYGILLVVKLWWRIESPASV
jgi:hypothetical protein